MRPTILICGTRRSDLKEADGLISSIRNYYKRTVEIMLYTNFTDYENQEVDEILIIENPYFGFADKVYAMVNVPREHVLFLDCDTLLLGSIDELFLLMDKFDIAVAHAPNRWTYKLEDIPDSFPEFNCGVILYKRSSEVNSFLHKWFETYLEQLAQNFKMPSGDQPSFRATLYHSNLRVTTLTPEYNCRFNMGCMVSHTVKILHGRISNFDYVVDNINKGPELPWTSDPGIRFVMYNDPIPVQKQGNKIVTQLKKIFSM